MPDSPVWHILASPGYAPETIAVNVRLHGWKEDSMLVKRIAACTHLFYLQPFTSYSEILLGDLFHSSRGSAVRIFLASCSTTIQSCNVPKQRERERERERCRAWIVEVSRPRVRRTSALHNAF